MLTLKSDFTYTITGCGWGTLIPNNTQAESIWREIESRCPGGSVHQLALPALRTQLKAAGYTLRKKPAAQKKSDRLTVADYRLLAELGVA